MKKRVLLRLMCVFMMLPLLTTISTPILAAHSQYYSIVLENNRNARMEEIDPSLYLEMDDLELKSLSDHIVRGIKDDYDKAKAIHDWVCENIYYDYDAKDIGFGFPVFYDHESALEFESLSNGERLLKYKRGVCSYYSKIFMQLIRAQGIPCMTVSGYAENSDVGEVPSDFSVDQEEGAIYINGDRWNANNYNGTFSNHAWNEVFVNQRWILVDTTWDSGNIYRNGEYIDGSRRNTYFDISEEEFAKDHRYVRSGVSETPEKLQFTDVAVDDYFSTPVLWAVNRKITTGTSATTFSPNAGCTRAQMVTFLWRAAGCPAATSKANPFTDLNPDAYYYDAVLWAIEEGITVGTSATTFSPNLTVTRAQVVTFLYRYADTPAVTGSNAFTDVAADAYYAPAVQWAVDNDITVGTSDTTFSPNNDCTRAQIVTFLYRDLAK